MENVDRLFSLTNIICGVCSFADSYNIGCLVLDKKLDVRHRHYPQGTTCSVCKYLKQVTGKEYVKNLNFHRTACNRSEQASMWYIYACPIGLHYFAVPFKDNGKTLAYIIGGPIVLKSPKDRTLFDTIKRRNVPIQMRNDIFDMLVSVPLLTLKDIESLARKMQIFITCLQSSTAPFPLSPLCMTPDFFSHSFVSKRQLSEQEIINSFIKQEHSRTNKSLIDFLNKIYIEANGMISQIYLPILELTILFTQHALSCGCDISILHNTSYRTLSQVLKIQSFYELAAWLIKTVNIYFHQFKLRKNTKHAQIAIKAIHYVDEHYASKLTLDEIAHHVYLSPSYFSKVFHNDMHCNFNTYLNYIRVEKSKLLLITQPDSITAISAQVGFEDQSYFTKVFKKLTGVTPGKYRELIK